MATNTTLWEWTKQLPTAHEIKKKQGGPGGGQDTRLRHLHQLSPVKLSHGAHQGVAREGHRTPGRDMEAESRRQDTPGERW